MIGFYDSGIGGLTILQQVLKLDPDFPFIYIADTEIMPLGDKTMDFIQNRVKLACSTLFSQGCEIVVLACNTASVVSIRHIQQVWLPKHFPNKQVLSVAKPLTELVEEKFVNLKSSKGLLLSTHATHSSGFYQYEFIKSGFLNIQSVACTGLADAIETNDYTKVKDLINS
jgi:glutamate racemase